MDMKLLVLVLILPLSHCAKRPKIFDVRPLYVHWRYFKMCDDSPGDVRAENVSFIHAGPTILINGVFDLARDVPDLKEFNINIRRCNDAAEDVNCERFQTWRFGGREACLMAEQDHMAWTGLIAATHPKLKCPVSKAVYRLINGTIDTRGMQHIFSGIPLEKYFWRGRFEARDHKLAACIDMGLQYLRGKH